MTLKVVVQPVDVASLDEIPAVAVAICINGNIEQRHLALLVKPYGASSHFLIHHGWDGPNYFYCDPPEGRYCWVSLSNLDPLLVETFADHVFEVWRTNQWTGVPYGVAYHSIQYIDPDRRLVELETGQGLTCATFVLECFAAYKLPVVDRETWPVRPEDAAWVTQILDSLARRNPGSAVAQRVHAGTVARFRPEEVAAAAGLFDGVPVPFHPALVMSGDVLAQMKAHGRLG